MLFLPPRNTAKNERTWKHIITTVGKCLLERNSGKIEEVRKEMESEKYGWQIGRQKYMDEVGNRMIVVGN